MLPVGVPLMTVWPKAAWMRFFAFTDLLAWQPDMPSRVFQKIFSAVRMPPYP
jgi:hypothetical protein